MKLEKVNRQQLIIGVECVLWVLCAVLMGYFFTIRDCFWDNIFLLVWLLIAVLFLALLIRAEMRFIRIRQQLSVWRQKRFGQ